MFKNMLSYDPIVQYEEDPEPTPEPDISMDDVSVKALGHSGKISLSRTFNTTNGTESNDVIINFSHLKELDMNGNEVGKSGSQKHSFNNFAQLDFTVSDVNQVKYQNLSASKFSLTASGIQTSETRLIGSIYVFNQTGMIKNGENETANVQPGTVKLSVDIENWKFCDMGENSTDYNLCQNGQTREEGKWIELGMSIKGKQHAMENGSKNRFSLGGSELILFENVMVDGSFTKMLSGFPKYSNDNKTEEYIFVFPLFNKTLSYDPLIQYNVKPVYSSPNVWIWVVVGVLVLLVVGYIAFARMRRKNNINADNLINERV
jgi:hypothetical protein